MGIKKHVRGAFRRFGWEIQRVRNANVEGQVLRDILRRTRPGVVLDVGANIGQYGDLLWTSEFSGTLISFEAVPEVHQQLSTHASVHSHSASWIVAPCAALGSKNGEIEINIAANTVSSSLLPMRSAHLDAAPESKYVGRQIVKIERLDELAIGLVPPSADLLLKIDTQGYEREVLDGATKLLPRVVAIQLELSLIPLYDGAPTLVDMVSYVESHGYELFGLVPGFKDLTTGRLLQVDGFFVSQHAGALGASAVSS